MILLFASKILCLLAGWEKNAIRTKIAKLKVCQIYASTKHILRYSARYTNFWVNKIRQLSIKFEIHYMSKNNIRYSEYTHIWYYSGIQLFFQIGQFYSCMAIIVFECQRPKNVYQSSFRISSRKIFSYIPFFQNHSCIRVQGLTKIWLFCSFSFQHNMQVHTELKHKKNNVFKKCLLGKQYIVRPYYSFFYVLSHGGTKFDYTTTNANDPCLETYSGKTNNNICKALSFLETVIFKNGHFKVFFSRCKQASSLYQKKNCSRNWAARRCHIFMFWRLDKSWPRSILQQCYDYFLFIEEDCGKMLSKDGNNFFFNADQKSMCLLFIHSQWSP